KGAAGWGGLVLPRALDRGRIIRVGTGDGLQHEPTIVGRETQRAELVERPAERHRPVSADPAIARAQPCDTAVAGRRENRPPCLRADRERPETRGDCPPSTPRRTATPGVEMPASNA